MEEEYFCNVNSIVIRLKNGNANTYFFHIFTINRRCKNKTLDLNYGVGNWIFYTNTKSNTILIIPHPKNLHYRVES